jgi:hypothetical protein
MKNLVGISGVAGSGKDTAGNYLVREFDFIKIAFADPLKRIVRDIFDFSEEQLWGPSEMRNKPDPRYPRPDGTFLTPRMALQQLGTQAGRNCYPNVWIDYALRLAKTASESPAKFDYDKKLGLYPSDRTNNPIRGVVISDLRFKNEVDALNQSGAFLIRLKRDQAGLEGEAGLHLSETEQLTIPDSSFNFIALNNGSLCDLYHELRNAMLEVL